MMVDEEHFQIVTSIVFISQSAQVMQIFSHTLLKTDMPPKDAPHKQMLII